MNLSGRALALFSSFTHRIAMPADEDKNGTHALLVFGGAAWSLAPQAEVRAERLTRRRFFK